MEEQKIIDISKIILIPSDTEIPVHNNLYQTKRPLCTDFPENSVILENTEKIVNIITNISEDLNESESTCLNNIPQYVEELQAIYDPLNVEECESDLFKDSEYTVVDNIEDLKKLLSQLLIRFDTSPKNYTKSDYGYLLGVLYKSLLYLYSVDIGSSIINEWNEIPRTDKVPSEKLVKETFKNIDSTIYATNVALNEEILNRLNSDSGLSSRITDIENKIPSEASSSNQLADKNFVHVQIATNASNFRGDWTNWASVPSDPLYYPEDYTGNKKPNNNDYLIIQNATDYDQSNTGIWRFVYKGDWDTLGKSGWEPQYRVELAFTQELLNAINSGITSLKVSNYDNYRLEIDNLLPLIYAGL